MTHRKRGPDGVSWALPWVGGVFSFSPGTKQGAGRCRVLSTLSYLRGTTYPLAGGEEALPDGSAQRWPLPLARPRSRDAGLGASGRIRFLPRVPLAACAWPVPALLCACFPEGPHMGLCAFRWRAHSPISSGQFRSSGVRAPQRAPQGLGGRPLR